MRITSAFAISGLVEREKGFEPSALCLGSRCSAPELLPLVGQFYQFRNLYSR